MPIKRFFCVVAAVDSLALFYSFVLETLQNLHYKKNNKALLKSFRLSFERTQVQSLRSTLKLSFFHMKSVFKK